ncbi:hypothetical protein [Runella limosa]|uniref:hypothetical protein n=1 Tax=Runella limosa TaxID=370978 RepID=UPI0003FD0556|nr:hypothetical protein [Runella limosa]
MENFLDHVNETLQITSNAVVNEARHNNYPVYYSALGLSVEVWPKNQNIFIEATPDVLEKLGIKLEDLQAEVL